MSSGGITKLLNSSSQHSSKDVFTPNAMFHQVESQSVNSESDVFEQEKQRGYEQGYNDAVNKAKSEWEEKILLINSISDVINNPIRDIDKIIQEKTADIAIAIATQIIRRELSIDSGQIVSAVKKAIDLIPKDGEKINLHINPKDVQRVNEIFSSEDVSNKYNIIQDPSIEVGGCKALTDYSLVDLSIEKQVASIAAQIFGDQRNAT